MGFLKKPTPLWITLIVVVILVLIGLYFVVPSYRHEQFRREAFSTHLVFNSNEIYIRNNLGSHGFDITSGYGEHVVESEHSDHHGFWNLTLRLENGTYHVRYSIKMNGSDIAGAYGVRLTLENASKLFNFTVATNEQLPRTFVSNWNTEVPPASELTGTVNFHSGWSRTPSLDRLLYLFIFFLPEYSAAIILAVTLLIAFLVYRFIKRRRLRT